LHNQGNSRIVRFGLAIAAFFFVVGGPISGYFLTRIFMEAKASASWPTVNGVVTKARVGKTAVGRYFADVGYTYRVGDQEFTGSRIRPSDGEYNIRDGAVQAIHGLPVGKRIAVFYNPSDPRQAVIRSGAGFQEYALLLVPIVMLSFGLWSFRLLCQTRRRSKRISGEERG
jgi:Protein of unknown function (DUF3592)